VHAPWIMYFYQYWPFAFISINPCNKIQSEMSDFGPVLPPGDLDKQCCLTYDWCRHLANSAKHTRRLSFGTIPYITMKHYMASSTKLIAVIV